MSSRCLLSFLLFFPDCLLCSPDWLQAFYVAEAVLELRISWMPGSRALATLSSIFICFIFESSSVAQTGLEPCDTDWLSTSASATWVLRLQASTAIPSYAEVWKVRRGGFGKFTVSSISRVLLWKVLSPLGIHGKLVSGHCSYQELHILKSFT